MDTLTTHMMIGPIKYSVFFQVLRIQSSFNLLLGLPWIHEASAIPSSLQYKGKLYIRGALSRYSLTKMLLPLLSQCYKLVTVRMTCTGPGLILTRSRLSV